MTKIRYKLASHVDGPSEALNWQHNIRINIYTCVQIKLYRCMEAQFMRTICHHAHYNVHVMM